MYLIRDWLAVGSLRETRDARHLEHNDVGAMLQLADAAPHATIPSLFLPVEDGKPLSETTLKQGVGFVLEQRAQGRMTLVACGIGISRSVTFAVAALREAENLSLRDAFQAVRLSHPEARPHPALWWSLCSHSGEEVPYGWVLRGPFSTEI